ncbi:uncharacterized protein LOC127103092 [Lathyrus oleraceus]|nr:uncharacterized protein LOC127103092 [Pisum sativum]
MLIAWLLNTIEPSLRSTLSYYDDSQSLWTHLKQRFCVVNGTRICQLKASLGECKQGKGEELSAYFGRLSRVWDELMTYVKKPTCKCGGCTCDINQQVIDLSTEDYLHHFLMGLDGIYATIHSNLLSQDPLPNIDQAYQRVIQDVRLLQGGSSIHQNRDNVMAFKATTDTRGKSKLVDNSEKFCTHCNREGHDKSSCFQLHGFPEWWGDHPRGGRGPGRGRDTSGRSGGRGRSIYNTPVRANKAITSSRSSGGNVGQSHAPPHSSEATGISGINPTQWQQILNALNNSKTKDRLHGKNDISWVIDTGASNHVTGNFSCLTNVKNIANTPVGLSDGKDATTIKEGSVILDGGLRLNNVLFMPQLNCNLISITQLIDDSDCIVQVTNALCVIQAQTTRTLIGAVWVYLLCNKTDIETMLLNFVAIVDRQFDKKIKKVCSDNGTEFNCLHDYFFNNGIVFETSCVGTPQQNGRVERKHQHIMNVARSLRFHGHLPMKFWGECVLAACYLINRTPSSVLNYKTPYEKLFGKVPKFDNMKIFGCLCYAHSQRRDGDKFASRSRKCIFWAIPMGKRDGNYTTHSTPPIVSEIEYVADDISWETYDASFGGGGASVVLQDNG